MSAARLLCDLERRGIVLWRDGEALRYRAPAGVITPAVRAIITTHKNALVPLLSDMPPGRKESKGSKTPDDVKDAALLPLLSFLPGSISETASTTDCGVPACAGTPFLRDAAGGWWCDLHFRRGLLVNAAGDAGYPPVGADPASGGPRAWRDYAGLVHRCELTLEMKRLRALAAEHARGSKESNESKAPASRADDMARLDHPLRRPGRSYLAAGALDPELHAAGYRLCEVCGLLTVHRTICLRCSPRAVAPPIPWAGRCQPGNDPAL